MRIQEIFLGAADLRPSELGPFLDHACGGDAGLRREVEALLEEDAAGTVALDAAIQAEAASLLEEALLTGLRLGPYRVIAEVGRGGTTPDGRPFFVTEEVAGEPIHLDSSARKLDLDARLQLFLRVCEVVSHAYRALVVHRDLEPSNIRVTADGVPRLLDFRVANLLDPGLTATICGTVPLTPEYASSQHVRGLQVTTASDVCALAAILLEAGRIFREPPAKFYLIFRLMKWTG